jgi:hypothetical protein
MFERIQAAQKRIKGYANLTPVSSGNIDAATMLKILNS